MHRSSGNGDGARASRVSRLRMASLREAVSPTVERILELVRDCGLDEERRHDLSVALSEALSNAAVHGNRLRPGRPVLIRAEVGPGKRAVVVIRDSGSGFDARTVDDPTEAESLMKTTGRGLFLMRQLVDRLDFNVKGNQVRLTVECPD